MGQNINGCLDASPSLPLVGIYLFYDAKESCYLSIYLRLSFNTPVCSIRLLWKFHPSNVVVLDVCVCSVLGLVSEMKRNKDTADYAQAN